MPVEKMILGDGWARSISMPAQTLAETPEEGILAALRRITAERFPRVLIVDDVPEARRLIRRILQSQAITRFMRPKMALKLSNWQKRSFRLDGPGPDDARGRWLRCTGRAQSRSGYCTNPSRGCYSQGINLQEKDRLRGQIHALMQKGKFMSDELADEVYALVK